MMRKIEWPTLGLLAVAYAVWAAATHWLAAFAVGPAILAAGVAMTLQCSLQHEAIHGHPTRHTPLNTLLVWPPLTLFIPYFRFRDTHLEHHLDSRLTDPFDDPESNFLDPGDWVKLPRVVQWVLAFNNTLTGRLLIGPLVGTAFFLHSDWRNRHDPKVLRGWLLHVPMATAVLVWVSLSPMPLWAYLLACYLALALLKIRTFLEHRAHEQASARTVIIEDRGPLALLFLNNNLHVVHHMHPAVPWYRLPQVFRDNRDRFLDANDGYRYRSYCEVFRKYLVTRKDPVAHPLWRREG